MTFKEYLAERKVGYDAQGDFMRLALSDPAFPDIATSGELTAYIEHRGNFHAVAAGLAVWEEYVAKQRQMARKAKST